LRYCDFDTVTKIQLGGRRYLDIRKKSVYIFLPLDRLSPNLVEMF